MNLNFIDRTTYNISCPISYSKIQINRRWCFLIFFIFIKDECDNLFAQLVESNHEWQLNAFLL